MANMCSRHHDYQDPDCVACNTKPEDVFVDWDESVNRAKTAGLYKCPKCGFEYYKTTDICPKCYLRRDK